MAEAAHTTKKRKKKPLKRERKERRFVPEQTQTTKLAFGGGMLGAVALGAGVYAQWLRDPALDYAPYIVAAGAAVLGVALLVGDTGAVPIRVGDAGIAIERGSELVRLAWCDMQRISVEKGRLIARSADVTLTIPIAAHRAAVAWILGEGTRRVPEVMDVKRRELEGLPEPKDSDGELVPIEALQVTGRRCAATDKVISFERDARLCPTCAQVYLKDHVPKKCLTCGGELGERAFVAGST
jgi:hypothetical protein